MPNKWKFYKVSGKVTFFVDDIMTRDAKAARKQVVADIGEQLNFAQSQGNIELLDELNVEFLRPATKKEVIDGYGKEAWEG